MSTIFKVILMLIIIKWPGSRSANHVPDTALLYTYILIRIKTHEVDKQNTERSSHSQRVKQQLAEQRGKSAIRR